MRVQGDKNFSEILPPIFLRQEQNGHTEEWRHYDRANSVNGNGVTPAFVPSENGNGQVSSLPNELRTPRFTPNSAEEGTAVFPYIPRKRQERNGLLIDYLYIPAPDAAGDQVDFFILGENRVGVLLADVAGKIDQETLPIIKTALRSNSAGLSTAATLRYLDQRFSEICTNGCAITAFYAIFDQNKRLLHFASAGHLPMLVYRPANGKVYLLNTAGLPFGAETSEGARLAADDLTSNHLPNGAGLLKSERVALHQNDLLVLYSDGLLAARNAHGEVWGRQRLVDFVRTFGELNPTEFLLELKHGLERFAGEHAVADDVTVIAVKNILRDLEKAHPEAVGCELDNRFMTTNEEQALLEILREQPDIAVADMLSRLAKGDYAYLRRELIEAHLAQLGPWLKPWERHGKTKTPTRPPEAAPGNTTAPAKPSRKQLHADLLIAFPVRQLLEKRYEFRGNSTEMAQAMRAYDNGDYEQALEEFTRLRPTMRSSASMHCFFGNLHLSLKAAAKAQHEYVLALQTDARCVHALLALTYIALLNEDYTTAIDSLTTALRLNQDHGKLEAFAQFSEKLIAVVESLSSHNEWIV